MTHRLCGWAVLAAAGFALSGCYTVLLAPGAMSSGLTETPGLTADGRYDDVPAGRTDDRYDDRYDDRDDLFADEYGHGYPVTGYSSPYGLYGFGSPFAYGPGLGHTYSYGGYAPVYGPYGYGYDPYYSYGAGGGTYVPPGYQLVTQQELDQLRAARDAARDSALDPLPSLSRQELERQRELESQRVWTQRSTPERPASSGYRTTRPTTTSSTAAVSSSSGSSSSASKSSSGSSSTKSSGSSAASKRSKRGR